MEPYKQLYYNILIYRTPLNSLGNALCSKYGNPTISSEGNAIWRDRNSNSITLNVTLNNSQDEIGAHFSGKLTVTYRTTTTNNDEF